MFQPQPNAARDSKASIAFDKLCMELQLAFVIPSDELIELNYLNLKSAQQQHIESPIGYHVPSVIFEQSKLLLRPGTYKEIIEERSALKQCGLATCGNKLKLVPSKSRTHYRLDIKKREISEETDSYFCCKECYQSSKKFETSLEDVAIQFKSEPLEKIKQSLQFIFTWYKGKIKIENKNKTNKDISSQIDDAIDPLNKTKDDSNSSQSQSNMKKTANNKMDKLNEMVNDLKIIEKNVAFNLHKTNQQTLPKKKWKKPINRLNKDKSKNVMKPKPKSKIKMEVQDQKESKEDNNNNNEDEALPEITMTKMEELFRIQQQEKLRIKQEAEKKQNQSKDRSQDKDKDKDMMMDKSANGRKIKVNKKELDAETLEKIEEEKKRIAKEDKHRQLYASMSDNAQLMGYYIGWCTDATSFFIMNNDNGYNHWKLKTSNEYNDMYSDPLLKQRQQSLIQNVIKYIMGLLNKFNVNPTLTSTVCNEIHLLVETFDITQGIPSFTAKTWCFMAFVFLKLVSHRIKELKKEMFDNSEKVKLVLSTIGYGEEYVTTLEQIVVIEGDNDA